MGPAYGAIQLVHMLNIMLTLTKPSYAVLLPGPEQSLWNCAGYQIGAGMSHYFDLSLEAHSAWGPESNSCNSNKRFLELA